MSRWSTRDKREFGLEFYAYLEKNGRNNIHDRRKLDKIYNGEFRNNRPGFPFGSVLYSLFRFNEVRVVNGNTIYFLPKIHNLKWSQPTWANIADKHGIELYSSDHQFKDGEISFKVHNYSEHTEHLIIENTGNRTVYFTDHAFLRGWANFSLEYNKYPLQLCRGSIRKVEVKYTPYAEGVQSAMLALEFKLEGCSASFHIVRFFEAVFETTQRKKLSDTPYSRPHSLPTWTRPTKVTVVHHHEDVTEKKKKDQVRLADYELPDDMNNLILALKMPYTYSDQRLNILKAPLSIKNYAEKLHLLLHFEEYEMERNIKRYNIPNNDQQDVTMKRDNYNNEWLVLEITAEKRPSLWSGDHQLLAYPVGETKKKYCGYVHDENPNFVKLGFNKELLDIFVEGMKFHIEFTVNRLNLRTQHRAAEFALGNRLAQVLFPVAPPSLYPKQTPDLKSAALYRENPEQYEAVQHIVAGSSKPAPYLVFGPPGTGKTVTLVEAIKQIIKCQPQSCILACASTNKAVDVLCERLLKDLDKSKVLRIYAKSYKPQNVPENLKECSNLVGNNFEFPKDLKSVNITTLLTSSRFVTDKFPQGHFTHVFVDEAGDAEETKCILPLAGLLHPDTGQVVLAGDPKQLWPIIKSQFARRFGMELSLLERLMTGFPCYQKTNDTFDNRFVTKLLRNYRSHPDILNVPNELFYDGELLACAEENQRNSCCSFELLPKKDFPIIFHGINSSGLEVLMDYVKKLQETANVAPRDIGIITSSNSQVQEIRQALKKVEKDYNIKDMSSIEVGTVHWFQGQEKRVILVSTVHSSLPFFKNDKWFNVAVTRAKALLIVVGNLKNLSSDRTWAHFINYCKKKGGFKCEDQNMVTQ